MMEIEFNNGGIDRDVMWQLLQELEAGSIDPQQRDVLMDLIERSAEAQDIYIEYFELAAMITEEAKTQTEQTTIARFPEASTKNASNWTKWAGLAAAAVILIGFILTQNHTPGSSGVKSSQYLTARVVAGTIWTVNDKKRGADFNDLIVREGSTVHVINGTVSLRHASGAEIVISGPAIASFQNLKKPKLHQGWMWINSSENHETFIVETPNLLLEDIGTRFGVHVPVNGSVELHLIDGTVNALSKSSQEIIATITPQNQGWKISKDRELVSIELEKDPFPSLEKLLSGSAGYETTILSQSPKGYFRMDEIGQQLLKNEVDPYHPGLLHLKSRIVRNGPSSEDGYSGFEKKNAAVLLPNENIHAPISLGSVPKHTNTLFEDVFDGKGSLHNSKPTVSSSGARWIASDGFDESGNLNPLSTGTASLAFTPFDGMIYTLQASFTDIKAPESGDQWVALAFSSGQSTSSMTFGEKENRFLESQTMGRAWVLFRNSVSIEPHFAMLGTTGKNGGLADTSNWKNWNSGAAGDIDLRIVLDTTGGAGNWKATWFAKRPDQPEYAMIRQASELLNEEIRSVGIGVGKAGISGKISHFSLSAQSQSAQEKSSDHAAKPANLSKLEGAVSLWLKPNLEQNEDEMIWSAGESPGNDSMHLSLLKSGQLSFYIENGRYDILVKSLEPIQPDQWHHITANWSPSSVELYVDGKMVANDNEFNPRQIGIFSEFRVGSGHKGSEMQSLSGMIDEIAFWNRTLTEIEIDAQFNSAKRTE